MRIALLSYRSKPHCGGQGVYVRHLSRELVALGHDVEVFSGQPYPELDPGVALTELPSLDLYREPDPFRTPRPSEFRDAVDVLEVATMWTGGFPEPLTFSLRAARLLRRRLRLRRRPRQPDPRLRDARPRRRAGHPDGDHHPPPDHRGPAVELAAARGWRGSAAPLVRLPARCRAGSRGGCRTCSPSRGPRRGTSPPTSVCPGPDRGRPARRRAGGLPALPRTRGCPAGSWRWPAPTPR